MGGQRTKWHRNIAENFNRLSRVHERYRRQTDGRRHSERERERSELNVSSRSLKCGYYSRVATTLKRNVSRRLN